MATQPSRGRHDPSLKTPVALCDDDHRKLYSLLDGEEERRVRDAERDKWQRRMELGMVALFVTSGSQGIAALLGAPNAVTALVHLIA